MARPLSLAARLTLFFALAAAVVFPIFGWVIIESMENHFEEGDTEELEVIAAAIEDALASVGSSGELALIEHRFDDILVGHHSASLYIADAAGRELHASGQSPDLSEAVAAAVADGDYVGRWNQRGASYRLLVKRSAAAGIEGRRFERHDALESRIADDPTAFTGAADDRAAYTIAVAVPIDHHLTFLASFRRTLWLMIASSIAIMSLMGWLAVRQGHAPLRDIVNRIRRITANQLTSGIPPETVPRELAALAVSFNDMLGRVNESFQRLTHFNADIAHELRTPVTNLMTQTQVALSRARTVDEYREILYSNMEEYERMAQMVGEMLFLAQADNGACRTDASRIDLAKEVRALFEYYEGWAEERGVKLETEGDANVQGDRQMLQRALGNLLANAIRHTPSGETVRVLLEATAEQVRVSVENPGEPIPPEHLPRLFDRFYRVDPSRQRSGEGAGLGLAIAKSIVDAHGGTLAVTSDEARTVFVVALPARAPRPAVSSAGAKLG